MAFSAQAASVHFIKKRTTVIYLSFLWNGCCKYTNYCTVLFSLISPVFSVLLCLDACVCGFYVCVGACRHLWASLIREWGWAKLLFLRSCFKARDIEGLFLGRERVGLSTNLSYFDNWQNRLTKMQHKCFVSMNCVAALWNSDKAICLFVTL